MAKQSIESTDTLNEGRGKINDNFTELYDGIDTATTLDTSGALVPGRDAVVAYIAAQISALVASAPGALDTLNELADALGDDANFATTVTNAIATKLNHTNSAGALTDSGTIT